YFLGYRFLSQEDSLKASEYVYPHSSVTFGINLLSAPLPFRYHVNAELLNKYDFYADAGFAYKDVLLFRDILVGLHHNLDHLNFLNPGEPPVILYNDRSLKDEYFIDYASNLLSLRLKTPDFPFHTFFKHRYIERDGKVEQRFLLGDFNNLIKTSESRNIDWRSNAFTLGANSHLGPLEIEYAYDRAEFDPRSGSVLLDYYPPSTTFSQPGDVYPHNVVPETESSANSLKIHSSYTGGLVAAATLSNLSQKNNYSQTESTTWKGGVDVSWIPDPVIGLFFKYRHRDVDMDNPDFVTLAGLTNTLRYTVRQGISYDKDVFTLSARYRPLSRLSLASTYEYAQIERENIDQWEVLEDRTAIHRINLTAHAKPLDKLKLKAIYEYKYYDDPAYNTDPDNFNQLRLTATYLPVAWINLYLDYRLTVTQRNNLRYLNNDPFVLIEGGERDGRRDRILASLSFMFSPKATLTASWSYSRWDVEQDLAYGKWNMSGGGDLPYIDVGSPYTDESNSFSLGLHYIPRDDITVTADVTSTLSEGEYVPGNALAESPLSLIARSDLEATETVLSFGISKKLPKDWELGFKFYTDIYDDKQEDLLDGKLFIGTVSIKRYF
ncbi:MAG: MtrB/PioB family outer membrane beta-barrel protein, partial [Desulfobulbaceae bacterium]|nr:MtrB/PioB family outer membrane beta-barrel protein [Desulfobulbaceae bacterium]